ncbi:MAG: thioredoxin domain-containing protein [Deinococcales bacterium]
MRFLLCFILLTLGLLAQAQLLTLELDDDVMIGSADAPLVLVEFSDFNCGFCGRFHRDTLPLLAEHYIATGKLRYTFRDFIGVGGATSHILAASFECLSDQLDNNNIVYYINQLFAHQGRRTADVLLDIIRINNLSLDNETFLSCVADQHYSDEVLLDTQAGISVGIRGTPGFFIGYAKDESSVEGFILQGALPFEVFGRILEDLLAPEDTSAENGQTSSETASDSNPENATDTSNNTEPAAEPTEPSEEDSNNESE